MTATSEGRDALSAISVRRALAVLDGFMGEDHSLTLSELVRQVGMPKSTVFRLVTQLTESGYVERDGNRYSLSTHVFKLGNRHRMCGAASLRESAVPHLAALFQHTGNTVSLAVLDGLQILYLDRIRGVRSGVSPAHVGETLPAMNTALGKAMIAFGQPDDIRNAVEGNLVRRTPHSIVLPKLMRDQLIRVRQSGIAFDNQETLVGLVCVAAPILVDNTGAPVGAISLSGPALRFKAAPAAPLVRRAAALIADEVRRARDLS
jgi:IclR family transcriptional regulator, KDG regulon repressor